MSREIDNFPLASTLYFFPVTSPNDFPFLFVSFPSRRARSVHDLFFSLLRPQGPEQQRHTVGIRVSCMKKLTVLAWPNGAVMGH